MKEEKKIDKLIGEIKSKSKKLYRLQNKMIKSEEMIGASLIKRHLGTQNKKRASHAFYLSSSKKGRTKLQHVSKACVSSVKKQVIEWKKYQEALKKWRKLTESLREDFKLLGNLRNNLEQKEDG